MFRMEAREAIRANRLSPVAFALLLSLALGRGRA
jgi:hypothetical protein